MTRENVSTSNVWGPRNVVMARQSENDGQFRQNFARLAHFGLAANGSNGGRLAALNSPAVANGISLENVPEPASAAKTVIAGLGILRPRRAISVLQDAFPRNANSVELPRFLRHRTSAKPIRKTELR
jgi:hypothetical protein